MAQPYPAQTPATPGKAKSGGVIIGLILMLLGIVGGIVLVVLGVIAAANSINGAPSLNIPGQGTVPLDAGTYQLYSDDLGLSTSDIKVTGPSGEITQTTSFAVSTLDRDGKSYFGVSKITIPSNGSYTFTVTQDSLNSISGQLLVGPDVAGLVGVVLLLVLGGVFGGGLLFFIGLIVLIIGLVRRSKSKRPPTPVGQYGAPPGGGYPQTTPPGTYPQPQPQPQPQYPQPGPPPAPQPQAPQYPQPGPPPTYPQPPQPGPPPT